MSDHSVQIPLTSSAPWLVSNQDDSAQHEPATLSPIPALRLQRAWTAFHSQDLNGALSLSIKLVAWDLVHRLALVERLRPEGWPVPIDGA